MPVIAFGNPKGGAGKTTACVLLCCEIAASGADVIVIDADPNQHISQWAELPGKPERLKVISNVNEQTILKTIATASREAAFVVIDLEGTASLMVSYAVTKADLVIVPIQGSHMDARQGARIFDLIETQSELIGRKIPCTVLFTRVPSALKLGTLQDIRRQISDAGINQLPVDLIDREPYRAIFSYGGTIYDLPNHGIKKVDSAIENVQAYFRSVISLLKTAREAA